MTRVQLSAGGKGFFSLCRCMQTGSGAHPGSYPMGTSSAFPRGKAARAWSWLLTSIWCWDGGMVLK